ncbi:NAD(P)-dependent dehydrogenase (short-subunit alcohol dehydrogenase family) [Rhizobium sp. BK049]|nr:NAD(P)-dependent dehydrogenase (short-subunit alcohol dehydrogenase family) [Rhizobium sp. BK049]
MFRLQQDGSNFRQKSLTRLGQFGAARKAPEKRRANLIFKIANLVAQRGLSDANPARRPRKVQFFGDGNEITKVTQLHVIPLRYQHRLCNILEILLSPVHIIAAHSPCRCAIIAIQEFNMRAIGKQLLITGVSSGLGRAFAEAALAKGYRVVGTVRNIEAARRFENLAPGRAIAVQLDVADVEAIELVVMHIEKSVGPVDVLINNAGYGHEGTLEESPIEEMRRQFEVNVFGAVGMMKAVLPFMRRRRAGHIINITSMGGFITMPGIAYYCGSKFALEGVSEVLAKEVKDFGISVTAVAPGSFRTDWAGRSMVRSGRNIADYDALFDPIRRAREEKNGKQPGDPRKAAAAVMALVEAEKPPVHLVLGADALSLIRDKLKSLSAEIDAWENLTLSTDFAEA